MSVVRGWCPDLFTPMRSGDGWLLRLKPQLGRISARQGQCIAERAAALGNGAIELTGRGNLQLRGFQPASAHTFARFAVAAGLASGDPDVERRRNILVSPLADDAASAVALRLERQVAAEGRLLGLPGKFTFGVDAGRLPPLPPAAADVLLQRRDGGWYVRLAGGQALPCEPSDAPGAACALALDWLATGAASRPVRGTVPSEADTATPPIGWQPDLQAFGFGLPFGQMDAAALDRLCRLSARRGDGVLHLTPWRIVLLSGVTGPLDAEAHGLIVTPDDPRLGVSACVGSRGCASGSVDARADAAALLAAGLRAPFLHVSGCLKGCAHPGPAAITLVGSEGRYGLVRNGRAGDTPAKDGLTIAQLAGDLAGSAGGVDHHRV